MCGIVGILHNNSSKKISLDLLKRMADTLKHRGPDDEGYYINKTQDFGLGFRRLSIIDLKTGHQPISNENQNIWVVLNGEIYNFIELRENLQKKGHVFYTQSDTEVLVHLYEDEGIDCLKYLRGMFAFCIWDDENKTLFLARDRVGKKPLAYALVNGGIIFASEIKALLEYPGIAASVDFKSLDHYLTYGYSLPGNSMFAGIKKLLPAHYLIWGKNEMKIKRYWGISYEKKLYLKESGYKDLILDNLKEAIKIRLISDVPLGVLLSGGIDSSCIVALMNQLSNVRTKTFSIGFDEKDYSELEYARLVAKAFDTDHHEFIVKPNVLNILPKLIWHYNEPFGDSSCIPTYFVSKIAREHVTVVLNGDGGDESFAGYERYMGFKFGKLIKLVPSRILKEVYTKLNKINQFRKSSETSTLYKICTYINILATYDKKYIYPRLISYFTPEEKESLYTSKFKEENNFGYSFNFLADIMASFKNISAVDMAMGTDILSYLSEDLLVKMDIATMANSLEGRSPFLDHRVMELAAQIPDNLKLKRLTTKYILRKSFVNILPDRILTRGKMGFGVPIGRWLRNDLKDFISSILFSDEFYKKGLFEKEFVKQIINDHMSGKSNYTHKLWNLLNFELWYRMFITKTWIYH